MPDNNTILITRVDCGDPASKYVFNWAGIVKSEAELLGFKVIDLQNENFNESTVKKIIGEYDPFLVFLNGHGTDYSIQGRDRETHVILRCKNDHLFKDRVVYALSCNTSKILGRSAFNKGCKCYFGLTGKFIFPYQDVKNVLEDFLAEPFMKVSNTLVLSIIRGQTVKEAYNSSEKLLDEFIGYWEQDSRKEAAYIVRWLKTFKRTRFAHIS